MEEQRSLVDRSHRTTQRLEQRRSFFRGGTLIAAEITDVRTHVATLRKPDLVRPREGCPSCGRGRLYVHDRRERKIMGNREVASVEILVFRCSWVQCRAVWRVLPAFLARHLRRTWSTVSDAIDPKMRGHSPVPRRTKQRWAARLHEAGSTIVYVLRTAGHGDVPLQVLDLDGNVLRSDVINAFGGPQHIAKLAAAVHRVCPNLRLL